MHLIPKLCRFDPNFKSYNYYFIPKSTLNVSFSEILIKVHTPKFSLKVKGESYGPSFKSLFLSFLLGFDH